MLLGSAQDFALAAMTLPHSPGGVGGAPAPQTLQVHRRGTSPGGGAGGLTFRLQMDSSTRRRTFPAAGGASGTAPPRPAALPQDPQSDQELATDSAYSSPSREAQSCSLEASVKAGAQP